MGKTKDPRCERGPYSNQTSIFRQEYFDVNGAALYLQDRHQLSYTPEVLSEYAKLRRLGLGLWGPKLEASGKYSLPALDEFAREIRNAKRRQGLRVA